MATMKSRCHSARRDSASVSRKSGPGRCVAVQAAAVPGPPAGLNGAHLQPEKYVTSIESSSKKILTSFTFPAALCTGDVSLTGSFNGWKRPFPMRRIAGSDDLVRSVLLPPGPTEFKFVADGEWRYSPRDPVSSDQSSGTVNNCKTVQVNSSLSWRSTSPDQSIFVTGSFLAWSELVPLSYTSGGVYKAHCCLPDGIHYVRFLVDGTWQVSSDMPTAKDADGIPCNVISVHARDNFAVYYKTGWKACSIAYRLLDRLSQPTSNWEEMGMQSTQSCLGPWMQCSIPAPKDEDNNAQDCQLEFVVNGPKDGLDKPRGRDSYVLNGPGGYKLSSGVIRPFSQACDAPYMLVSDVDGTMIDDSHEGIQYAEDFREYWENSATLRGSILVYNTGRSIGQLTGLLEHRKGSMAVPDAIITAVGTKVFLLNRKATRVTADSESWVEAEGWSALLSRNWSLETARRAAESCVHSSDRVHWLDQGTEHPHRIALSVHKELIQEVEEKIKDAVDLAGYKAQFIVSGSGDYQYMDILSIHGGKRNAMEYVRQIYGVTPSRVVAAGDSGNDILMFQGVESKGIVVGNAQPALLTWTVDQEQDGRITLADKPLAHGVLEGLARQGLY